MNLDLKEITFIIVSYKAKKIIYNCINSLPKLSKKIVVENSYDRDLKSDLESKYDNIEVILNENLGMGASNNVGIKKANTKYAFVLNPDVIFKENTFLNLVSAVKNIDNFSIISPINSDKDFPNYIIKKSYPIINEHIMDGIWKEANDYTKWDLVDFVHNKYNRMVIYRGDMFHASLDYFGKDMYDGRLFQTFFFNTEY